MKTGRRHSYFYIFLLALVAGACATPSSEQPSSHISQKPSPGDQVYREIKRFTPQVLTVQDYVSQYPVHLSVRAATQADLESERFQYEQKIEKSLAVFGVGSVGLGAVAGPMFGGSMILGGVFIAIGSTAIAATNSRQQRKIELALRQSDFVGMLGKEFGFKLQTSADSNHHTLEIVPLRYGIVEVKEQADELCVVADLTITLLNVDQVLYRDRVLISPYLRSQDAPAPVCMSRGSMSFDDARPLHDALAIYAAAMPSIVQQRIPGLPWKH